jgi:hypothetical protein
MNIKITPTADRNIITYSQDVFHICNSAIKCISEVDVLMRLLLDDL